MLVGVGVDLLLGFSRRRLLELKVGHVKVIVKVCCQSCLCKGGCEVVLVVVKAQNSSSKFGCTKVAAVVCCQSVVAIIVDNSRWLEPEKIRRTRELLGRVVKLTFDHGSNGELITFIKQSTF